ncbi:MAG: hypothetical protein ACK4TA_20020 [Saprospiraceae bacterium]
MRKVIYSILGLVILLNTLVNAQSGWVRQPGDYYIKLSYSTFSSSNYYDTSGILFPRAYAFAQRNIFLYAEYGVIKNLALTLNWAPWKANRYEVTDWVSGVGDPLLELKYALPLPFPASLGIAAEFPLGNADLRTNDINIPQNIYLLPTGDGEWNYLLTLAASHSLAPEPAYIQGYLQYNYRTHYQDVNFQNQLRYGLEIGYRFGRKLWINAALRGQALSGKKIGRIGDFTRGDGTTFNQLHLGASWRIVKNLSITFDYENFSDWFERRRNLYSGPLFILGLSMQSTD